MNKVSIGESSIDVPAYYNVEFFDILFSRLKSPHDLDEREDEQVAWYMRLDNLKIIAYVFEDGDVAKAINAFRSYIQLNGGKHNIEPLSTHKDYLTLRNEVKTTLLHELDFNIRNALNLFI